MDIFGIYDVNSFGIYDIMAIIVITASLILVDRVIRLFSKYLMPSKPPYLLFNFLYISFLIPLFISYFMGKTHLHALITWILSPLFARLINQIYDSRTPSPVPEEKKQPPLPEPSVGPSVEEKIAELLKQNKQ